MQAVTIDEADSYLAFVQPSGALQWYPAANNHVLNTLLIRLITSVFGLSHVTLRVPALAGAVIYISAAYCLVKLISPDLKLQWPLFVCLVFNPFVFDYLVAARGYALALGFLACAIAIPLYQQLDQERTGIRPLFLGCALSSLCLGFSFSANFSFGFVDAATLLVICGWTWRHSGPAYRGRTFAQLLLACVFPGALVTLLLSAPGIMGLHATDLTYGARSLNETLHSVTGASLYELNPNIVNPLLYGALANARKFLLPLLGVAMVGEFVLAVVNRRTLPEHSRQKAAFGIALACIITLTLAAHWLSFELCQLLLPKDRTALYFVPLVVLIAGVLASISAPSRGGRIGRIALMGVLYGLGSYHLLCLRLNYFKEWRFDADVQKVYSVLAYYNHTFGVRDIASSWRYVPSLNFYRKLSGSETIAEFQSADSPPLDRLVYVLYEPDSQSFMEEQKLKVVYRGDLSAVVVAIRPEAETRPR